ncbi:hypothetical protein DFJ58DRAFT_729072 [Suillus subalutaceus]|uniref:uncharacterized protein n=1 Tax=Suillus subalutaceus TaxID=48586 RepID=UPI001B886394|nr:uncharacterized protein DFJ58DRAFT_729072 [Suillus subalutaceus]KAG1851088.1 hypothetical protein DFJ58DRAFT_729072 [Suillus subalutaceus]
MAQPSDILSSGPLLLSDPALDSVPCSLSSMCFHLGSLPSEVLSSDPMQQVKLLQSFLYFSRSFYTPPEGSCAHPEVLQHSIRVASLRKSFGLHWISSGLHSEIKALSVEFQVLSSEFRVPSAPMLSGINTQIALALRGPSEFRSSQTDVI